MLARLVLPEPEPELRRQARKVLVHRRWDQAKVPLLELLLHRCDSTLQMKARPAARPLEQLQAAQPRQGGLQQLCRHCRRCYQVA